MKKIAIIGAMQVEIDLIKNEMEILFEHKIAGFSFYEGTLFHQPVILTRCGVGKVNAASCTQILIDKFEIDAIINTGVAGSLRDDIKVCDIVVSSDVTHHDVRSSQMKNLFPYQEAFYANKQLIDCAITTCDSLKSTTYHIGRIVSGECFVEDSKIKETIIDTYSPACVEMEGSSIGHVAFLNDIPFLIIRCISDNADEQASLSYDSFEKIAGEKSSTIVMNMIKNISSVVT
ncbi:5'-methylthioadenosine/adenosylhomocysteine nucleosidase [Cytobacillus sp. Hm23]